MTPHPPKPRLTLRVGFTGHRPNKLPDAALPRIRQQLLEVFAAIERAAQEIRKDGAACYAAEPPVIRLICGFAEGADQMAATICPAGWQVEAILPFPRDEYLNDFATSARGGRDVRPEFLKSLERAAVVTQLPLHDGDRDQGYADAGGYMLRQIDVLIAVWDGLPPKPGGTGAIVREAHAAGIPVVWLATREERTPRLIKSFDQEDTPTAAADDCTQGALTATLGAIFASPAGRKGSKTGATRTGIDRYLVEHWHPRCLFAVYDGLRRVANGQMPRLFFRYASFEQRSRDWDAFLRSAPDAKDLRRRITDILLPRHIWADALAVHYSHLYRSAYVFAYVLSAVAVFIALGTVFIHDDPHAPASEVLGTKAVFVFCELLVIGGIILLVLLGRRGRWHERWLNYRTIAELLRHGRFLAFVSEFGRTQEADRQRDLPWMLWYVRATMREVGLPTATFDRAYQQRILDATLADEITGPQGQLAYNRASRASLHHIDHFLHQLGTGCFLVTSIFLLLFLALFGLEQAFAITPLEHLLLAAKPFVTLVSAGLPALGAAVSGIRAHGDFESSIERCAHTVVSLEELKHEYARAMARGVDLDDTAQLLIATAGAMSEDLTAWQELYGRKRLALPA